MSTIKRQSTSIVQSTSTIIASNTTSSFCSTGLIFFQKLIHNTLGCQNENLQELQLSWVLFYRPDGSCLTNSVKAFSLSPY